MISRSQQYFHRLACLSLLALIVLCIAWELWLAPLRAGGSFMALKALPLLLPLRAVLKRDNYTMQWTTMLIWLYFTEGVVRAYSDQSRLSAALALAELCLALLYFIGVAAYLRPIKRAAKAAQKAKLAQQNSEQHG
ncbi:DUF2069 domain-containing protein [Undibacterium curvum]|uniref:DUF2069 domain-containing protein n=1 Tax=Undibacterium curvum TaxID=2762294 RepID=A0ABR7A0R8_9BURK|nr:DUF2069 domain-containing protein [Undibacterium curvum]MBC3930510.1 DUF2069 domain-containing protein [Undibacterium curvum]